MKNILNNHSVFFLLFSFIIITSCNSPSSNNEAKAALSAQEQLEIDLAMYKDTWDRFSCSNYSLLSIL
jgi:hypothetical protein|tara:strand:- start:1055 stop:1258 length:204 start_codon:yes stop_codon:yes gene_type:complete